MTQTTTRSAVPANRLEQHIEDFKPPLSDAQALAESHRCLYCYDAPCVQACPTEINIPEFIRRIATGNVRGAAKTILEANILGHSCARVCPVEVLCAGSCVYNEKEEPPIMIGKLQRYATEYAYEKGIEFFKPGPATGKRVALIGAGPASLAAAAELRIRGHETVILEGRSVSGGLNATGVAPYKYKLEDALKEVAFIQRLGVEIRENTLVGRDVNLTDLASEYDAVFLGVGLGPDSQPGVPGEDKPGCVGAVHLIERIKTEPGFKLQGVTHAAVIGGGNTALDVVRELKQLGVPCVFLVYRRDEASMSGYAHELEAARLEGVEVRFNSAPLEVVGEGHVTGLRCVATRLGAPDANGRQSLEQIAGSEFVLPAELVVKATGQEKLSAFLGAIPGVKVDKGRVVVDQATGQTGNPKFFAGGDCANGGKEVVNAAAEGKRAARGIDAFLRHGAPNADFHVTIK
ncbi:MAG TPA: NAD(P)-dependent oxidoreductase [Oscillatoriaceae cyanobacterium]